MYQILILTAAVALCASSPGHRLDCQLKDAQMNEETCRKRECLWAPSTGGSAIPRCYLDTSKVGFHLKEAAVKGSHGLKATLHVNADAAKTVPFPQIEKLAFEATFQTENILRIRITDPANRRYEVPIQGDLNLPRNRPSQTAYDVSVTGNFNLVVTRKGSKVKIIDTSIGGLIYSDTFIQFVTHVATENVYGIGENYKTSFKHDFNYKTYPLFARDRLMGEKERNNYGVHPYYTVVEEDGKAHGILLLNSNAMAFTTLPTPAIAIKTLGGILDFFIFVGESPEHVTQLYTSMVGRPVMPPFWSLGFQLCRYGYQNLDHVKKVVQRNLDQNVPLDVKYLDIDYMDEHRDFTYDKANFAGLPEYLKETQEKHNLRWTLIIDPAIQGDTPGYRPFDEGYKRDLFVKWPASVPIEQRTKAGNAPMDKGVMYGHVWPTGPVGFPDFLKNDTRQWWIEAHKDFHKILPFDAIWIDMNEPSNFPSTLLECPKSHLASSLPSLNFKENLETQSLCMTGVQGERGEYRHYDVHSLYGLSETKATYDAVRQATGKRSFVVTRSTFPTSGKYAAHWLGDNYASWEQMRQSIIGMLDFTLFGISFTGADICGFTGNTSPELCRRWLQLGAFYPFSRSHNDVTSSDQDPAYFREIGHPEVTQAAVDALSVRYQLLHYLYTSFYRSNAHGETLVRPLHHAFPADAQARTIDQQFFLGPHIMVNPFLFENQTSVKAYLPKGPEWYKFSGDFVTKVQHALDSMEFPDSESHRPLLFRAGSILPIVAQERLPKPLNTANLRKVPIDLWVLPTSNGQAHGQLFYDDGESIDTIEEGAFNLYEFTLNNCNLTIARPTSGYRAAPGSGDILRLASIHIALPKAKTESVQVTVGGVAAKHTLVSQNLKVEANLDLLTSHKTVSVVIKGASNVCILH